jgi:hypothetical protein
LTWPFLSREEFTGNIDMFIVLMGMVVKFKSAGIVIAGTTNVDNFLILSRPFAGN